MEEEEIGKSPAIFFQVERKNQQSHETSMEEALGGVLITDPNVSDASLVATVKLEFPDAQVLTQAWKITSHVMVVKKHLAHWLQVPEAGVQLYCEGVATEDQQTLASLGVKPHGTVLLQVQSTHADVQILVPSSAMLHVPLFDVITVHVIKNGRSKDVVVEIENYNIPKPFLGGFLQISTKTEFHHAQTQTVLTIQGDFSSDYDDKAPLMASKSTATYVECGIQQSQNAETQVSKFSLLSNGQTGRILVAKQYKTFDEQNTAAQVIQRQFRQYVARRPESQSEVDACLNASDENKTISSKEEMRNSLIQRPEVTWALSQLNRRPNVPFNPPKIDLNQTVTFTDLQRLGVAKSNRVRERMLQEVLNKAAAPQSWILANGQSINVDTPQIECNRQLQGLYLKLSNETAYQGKAERMELLFLLKRLMHGDSSTMAKDLVKLADREMDFITRGATTAALNALRARMTTLFRRYVQQHMDI